MIITISQIKGGVGKSTIAFQLALLLNKKYQVKVIDLDNLKTLTKANHIRASKNKTPLDIITITESKDLKEIILNNSSLIYIIDTGGFDSDINRIAIMGADIVITPTTNKGFDLMGNNEYIKVIKALEQLKKERINNFVVLNNIAPQTKNFDDFINFIEKTKHLKVLQTIIRQRTHIAEAGIMGLSITEYKPNTKASLEFQNLSKEILKITKIT